MVFSVAMYRALKCPIKANEESLEEDCSSALSSTVTVVLSVSEILLDGYLLLDVISFVCSINRAVSVTLSSSSALKRCEARWLVSAELSKASQMLLGGFDSSSLQRFCRYTSTCRQFRVYVWVLIEVIRLWS